MADKYTEYKNNLQRTVVASVGKATYEDITDASTSYVVTKIPEHAVVTGVHANVITAFNESSATFKIGYTGDDDYWFSTLDITTAAVSASSSDPKYFATGADVVVEYSAGSATSTTGEIEIIVEYIETTKNNGAYVE